MTKEDVKRYLSFEAPGMGVVANRPAAVVCFRVSCDEVVPIDPDTIVPEDRDAVDVEARDPDSHNVYQVEIYCCADCRNAAYAGGGSDA